MEKEFVVNIPSNQQYYYIMSINVVAYMRSKGINPIDKLINEDGKLMYLFENTKEFRDLMYKYGQDKELKAFIEQLRITKAEMREMKR
jgi:hypothetical protein